MSTKNSYVVDYEQLKIELSKINQKKMCENIGIRQNSLGYALKNESLTSEWLGLIAGYLGKNPGEFYKEGEPILNLAAEPQAEYNANKGLLTEFLKLLRKPTRTAADEQRLDELTNLLDK